ncbi:Oidioi.mRNA.OKI2018_I69.chr2.g8030.t1.cds [Oikopleura dioica]|uniref:Oidioi.mRNA.OKI2018_I69.chr2.g8030.t1.cds n=1 Tax=Oikopleura dioica TaxID=34765 RepID=A0ABN7TBF8_OIKDI|nr:Oidioi.mRNA.OKI2018_I69.chr2.g8030.t1.cds [Oikopleura dioica]
MTVSLLRYANIDETQFESNQGVTEAFDKVTRETVIVKAILLRGPDHANTTRQEASTLQELNHANIVRFVDFLDQQSFKWAFGKMSFIIMENCAGGNLENWINKIRLAGRMPTKEEVKLLGAQIISGLSYCHHKKKLHLDLKPANIFLLADFLTIKIGDFGSALSIKSVKQSLTSTSPDAIRSTPLYAAPEFYTDEDVKKSPRMDVWGFGLILQELATLEHAFGRVNGRPALMTQIQTNIQIGNRVSLFEIFGESDEYEELENLIAKCTHLDRKSRFRNAIDLRYEAIFGDFLRRIENGEQPARIVPCPFPNADEEAQKRRVDNFQKDDSNEELQNQNKELMLENKICKKIMKAMIKRTDMKDGKDTVRIRIVSGLEFAIAIKMSNSISFLKEKINERTGINTCDQLLIFGGKSLCRDASLSKYAIKDGSVIHLSIRPEIYLKQINGKIIRFQLDKEIKLTDAVHTLKKLVEEIEGIPPAGQTLIYNGIYLPDTLSLLDAKIEEDSEIWLILKREESIFLSVKFVDGEKIELKIGEKIELTDTVLTLKNRIREESRKRTGFIQLIWCGRVLDDSTILSYAKIDRGSTIHAVYRERT